MKKPFNKIKTLFINMSKILSATRPKGNLWLKESMSKMKSSKRSSNLSTINKPIINNVFRDKMKESSSMSIKMESSIKEFKRLILIKKSKLQSLKYSKGIMTRDKKGLNNMSSIHQQLSIKE